MLTPVFFLSEKKRAENSCVVKTLHLCFRRLFSFSAQPAGVNNPEMFALVFPSQPGSAVCSNPLFSLVFIDPSESQTSRLPSAVGFGAKTLVLQNLQDVGGKIPGILWDPPGSSEHQKLPREHRCLFSGLCRDIGAVRAGVCGRTVVVTTGRVRMLWVTMTAWLPPHQLHEAELSSV